MQAFGFAIERTSANVQKGSCEAGNRYLIADLSD
jgi:hypothetical protein